MYLAVLGSMARMKSSVLFRLLLACLTVLI